MHGKADQFFEGDSGPAYRQPSSTSAHRITALRAQSSHLSSRRDVVLRNDAISILIFVCWLALSAASQTRIIVANERRMYEEQRIEILHA